MKLIKKYLLLISLIFGLSIVVTSCAGKDGAANTKTESTEPTADEDGNIDVDVNISGSQFHGTMSKKWKKDEPTKKEQKNIDQVKAIFNSTNIEVNNKLFECIYGDIDSSLSVWSLLKGKDDESLNYYGVIIRNNGTNYEFADICHGKNPSVDYDEASQKIYMSADVIEGTGTHVDALYVFDVKESGEVAYITYLDPYEVQEYFIKQMTYDVHQDNITLKLKNRKIAEVVNTEDGEGTLRAVAIGEQIAYEFDDDHNIKVNVVPGVKFGVGSSLYYEDMPTISADVKLNKDKLELSNIRVNEDY